MQFLGGGFANCEAQLPDAPTDGSSMTELVDGVRSLPVPQPEPGARAPVATPPAQQPNTFERLIGRLGHEIRSSEALVEGALRGGYERLDAATLIALQAGIYRYSEAIDLTVKVVDRATGGVKTVLEGGR